MLTFEKLLFITFSYYGFKPIYRAVYQSLYFRDHDKVFRSVDDIKKDAAHQMRIRGELDRQRRLQREQRKNRL